VTAKTAAWRKWTVRLLAGVVAVLVAWDVAAYSFGGQDATITQVVRDNSAEWPLIAVAAGVVVGHIWWTYRDKK
jgi:hypothetical protein